MPDVSILVVGYNSASIIGNCLGSIPAACTRYSYEVLLVDNGDGSTAALVARDFPAVRIIPSKGNVGFAAGNNMLAAEAKAPFLLLANPDLEMRPGAVDELMKATQRYPDAAAWGGVTLDRNGCPDIGNTVHVPSLSEMASRILGRSSKSVKLSDPLKHDQRVEALSGGFVMFSHEAWKRAGGMDERYFLYCEEVDLFFRLAKMEYVFWRVGASRAFHDIGHGENASPMRELYLNSGIMQFAILHWGKFRWHLAFAAIWLLAAQRYAAGVIFGRWSSKLKITGHRYSHIVLRPNDWRHGYHPTKGLLARMRASKG